jgi:hypothetical protein
LVVSPFLSDEFLAFLSFLPDLVMDVVVSSLMATTLIASAALSFSPRLKVVSFCSLRDFSTTSFHSF